MELEEVMLLSELTIFVPSYNRPLALERVIEYWRDTPVMVHILDGSDTPWFPKEVLQGKSNITYHHLPKVSNESAMQNYRRRMLYSLGISCTKFTAICADDDFFAISGLSKVLYELDKSSEIQAALGAELWFTVQSGRLLCRLIHVNDLKNDESLSPEVAIRLKNGLSLFYGIFKTDFFETRQRLSFEHFFENAEHLEMLTQYVSRSILRSRAFPHVFWLRQSDVLSQFKYTAKRGHLSRKESRQALFHFKEQLVKAVQIGDARLSLVEAKQIVKKFLRTDWRTGTKAEMLRDQLKKRIWRNLDTVSIRIPLPIKQKFNLWSQKLLSRDVFALMSFERSLSVGRREIDVYSSELVKAGIGFELAELHKFEELLLKPRGELRLLANI
jgi:glycosyltransferase domain-containing protein